MRTFSASWIFPITSPPIKNGSITVDDNGKIVEIGTTNGNKSEGQTTNSDGIIVPGFINAHCHLELSHMKGQVREGQGMAGFISELVPKRNKFPEEEIKKAAADAETEMMGNGIVAVGDISNTDHSFGQKAKANLHYHTFIEVFDIDPTKARSEFEKGITLQAKIKGHTSSIVPHAPYTVSPELHDLIGEIKQEITCIHNQESKAENELFVKKSGALQELFHGLGFDLDWIEATGKNSIRSSLPHLLRNKRVQLVHNTFTSKKDIAWAQSFMSVPVPGNEQLQLYWCTCPNANLYIENKLPDYDIFMIANAKMTLGTDSYASNWSLSIFEEIKTIHKHFPHIPLEKLFTWATYNGAEFLGIEKKFGSLEKGRSPGLVLVKNCDVENSRLQENSTVERLV